MIELLTERLKLKNKTYYDKYVEIITNNAKSIKGDGYEIHHILPKSVFPEYTKCKENLVILSAEDHYRAHEYLALAFDNKQMWYAFNMMKNTRSNNNAITDEEYHQFKINLSEAFRQAVKNNPNSKFGNVDFSKEMIQRRWNDPEQRIKQSVFMKVNNPMNNSDSREKLSNSKKGKSNPWMIGDKNVMKRPEVSIKFKGENNPNYIGSMVNEQTKAKFNLGEFINFTKIAFNTNGYLARRIFHWFKNGCNDNEVDNVVLRKSNIMSFVLIVSIFSFKGESNE
jgi:hypothetical protein